MLRQLFVFVFAFIAGNAIADAKPQINPIEEYVALEVERLELEQELFGITDNGEEIVKERDFWFAWYAFHPDTELYQN